MPDWVGNERGPGLLARVAILSSIAVLVGCGGGDTDDTGGRQSSEAPADAETSEVPDASAPTDVPSARDDTVAGPEGATSADVPSDTSDTVPEPTEATTPADDGSETDDDAPRAVVVEENWFNSEDAFGTPLVHWIGVVENTGPDPVEIGVEVAALDASGSELGSSDSQFPWTVRAGGRVPFAVTLVNLRGEADSIRSDLRVGSIPDFRAERVGVARFTGDVVAVVADDEEATVTVIVENVGEAEARPTLLVVITDDGASLVGAGGLALGPMMCPGETAEVTTVVSFGTPPEGLDPSLLAAEAYFPDEELSEPQPC